MNDSCSCMKLPIKVVILDLDMTLWDGEKMYKDSLEIMKYLNDRCIKVYCISANMYPRTVCEQLGISQYFHRIYCSRDSSKISIIKNKILKRHPWLYSHEMMAFDDQYTQLLELMTAFNGSIHLFHVNENTGIDLVAVKKLI
jgi:phosphoglycolate phosphatase-like HAD superfamily hydrolase